MAASARITRIGLDSSAAWIHQSEIERFIREADTSSGLRSILGAQLEGMASGVTSPPTYDLDGKLVATLMGRACSDHRIAWRTFHEMGRRGQGRLVVVLHLLFDDSRLAAPLGIGDLAKIAHLTDAAERARVRFVATASSRRAASVTATLAPEARRYAIEREFWRTARRHHLATLEAAQHARLADDDHTTEPERRRLLARHAQAKATAARHHAELKAWLDAYARTHDAASSPDVTRAALAVSAHEDRSTSARDALAHLATGEGGRELRNELVRQAGALRREAFDAYSAARKDVVT